MCKALGDLRSIHQRAEEDEESYKNPLNDAIHCRQNVHEKDENMKFYIDVFLLTNHAIVAPAFR